MRLADEFGDKVLYNRWTGFSKCHTGLFVNSIRGLYPKDLHEWLTWIQYGKSLHLNREKIQNLINQQRRNLADVVWERNASKQKSSLQTASQMGSQEKFPRPLRQGEFTSDSQKVKQFIEKNQENIRKSISPVDGDGFVSTADREKMITVLMGIPQQQLDNMDGAAALDYLTQKQFKVPSDWRNLCSIMPDNAVFIFPPADNDVCAEQGI